MSLAASELAASEGIQFTGRIETTLAVQGTSPTHRRWLADDEAVPAERAAPELKLLEVVVEVERRPVVDVLRIVPVRHQADENGHLDASAAMRRAQKRAPPEHDRAPRIIGRP